MMSTQPDEQGPIEPPDVLMANVERALAEHSAAKPPPEVLGDIR